MVEQLIYRGTAEGYRVVAVSEGLMGKGLSRTLQRLSRMPANWAGVAPIFSRTAVEDGMVVMRTAVDPNGTRSHHISHIFYIPREDAQTFSGGIIPGDAFLTTYRDVRGTDTLPAVDPAAWAGASPANVAAERFGRLFGGNAGLLASFLSAAAHCATPANTRRIKGVCVLAEGALEAMSADAYHAMEALMRLYPGLWDSGMGYRTLWTNPENNAQYPVFFATRQCMARYDQALNAGYLVVRVGDGTCAFAKGELPRPEPWDESLARAMIDGDVQGVLGTVDAIRAAQERARREAEEARAREAERKRREAERLEQQRREAEEARAREAERKRREAEELERQRRAEAAARRAEEEARKEAAKRRAEEAARQRIEAQRQAEEAALLAQRQAEAEAARQRAAEEARRVEAEAAERKRQEAEKAKRSETIEAPKPTPADRGGEAAVRPGSADAGNKPQPVSDPYELGQKLFRKLLRLMDAGGYPGQVESELLKYIDALKKKPLEFRLPFLEGFLDSVREDVLSRNRRDAVAVWREPMLSCTVALANGSWNALFHRAALTGASRACAQSARQCFASLKRISAARVADPKLRGGLADWAIACSVFYCEPWYQKNLIEHMECLQAMQPERRAMLREELLALAGVCIRHAGEADDRIAKCGLSALFYGCIRFKAAKLLFDWEGARRPLAEARGGALGRALEKRLKQMTSDAAGVWY